MTMHIKLYQGLPDNADMLSLGKDYGLTGNETSLILDKNLLKFIKDNKITLEDYCFKSAPFYARESSDILNFKLGELLGLVKLHQGSCVYFCEVLVSCDHSTFPEACIDFRKPWDESMLPGFMAEYGDAMVWWSEDVKST